MAISIQIKRGANKAKIDAATLKAGELALDMATNVLYVGKDGQTGTAVPIAAGSTASADKLTTARNFSTTGDVTATAVSFDGSADVALATTIANGAVTKAKTDAGVQASLDKADTAVQSVTATANAGIAIGGTATAPTVGIKLDPASTAGVAELGADGLKITVPTAAEYKLVKLQTPTGDALASYKLQKDGTDITGSATIDIAKDLVVTAGEIVVDPAGQPAGTYLKLTIANQTAPVYIDVAKLVDAYTSGSAADDAVVVAISDTNKVTATLTDGKITLAKLATSIQTSLGKADSALQEADIVATGAAGTNGTITVKGNEIAVKGLGDAAYKSVGTTAGSIPVLDAQGKLPGDLVPDISDKYVEITEKGAASGVATLGADTKIPAAQIPVATTTALGGVMGSTSVTVSATGVLGIGDLDCGELS